MSFVLQLGAVTANDQQQPENNDASIVGQELTNSTVTLPIGVTVATRTTPMVSAEESTKTNNSTVAQDVTNLCEISTGHLVASTSSPASIGLMKSIGLTYPAIKSNRENQKISGSLDGGGSQVLTTRVVSQKLSSSVHQSQSNAPQANVSNISNVAHLPGKSQNFNSSNSDIAHVIPLQTNVSSQNANSVQQQQQKGQSTNTGEVVQCKTQSQISNAQTKVQSVSGQQILTSAAVKAITAGSGVTNIHRIHVKTPNIVGQGQTVNLQKVKTITNVAGNQFTAVQRNSITRIQTLQKSQVLTSNAQSAQFTVNQVVNNVNVQRVPHSVAQGLQKTTIVNTTGSQKAQQVYSNPKVQQQSLGSHLNHKTQQQQQHYQGNQQQVQQTLQKVQSSPQKTIATQRQQVQNNVHKSTGNSVAGIQKTQAFGLSQTQQQSTHLPKNGQPVQTSQQQRPTAATLQKSQTLAAIGTNRSQAVTNICKSSSASNITKLQQNSNVLNVGNQQTSQQLHLPPTSHLQQQLLHQPTQQQVMQKQQQTSVGSSGQRLGNVHQKIGAVTTVPNNQRAQTTTANSKVQQQQMLLRVGVSKAQPQNVQQTNLKTVPQKILNVVKQGNVQNNVVQQQALHRNNNSQSVKIVQQQQQQQQNIVGPQNAQKQPGCIKTIPAQKPGQRNHAQKATNVKTSISTNVGAPKGLSPTTVVTQKMNIKTLLPQQTTAPNMLLHKNPSVKIQQQTIQQKQLIIASQYPPQVRSQTGQIKTLLPVSNAEPRKDMENKSEPESQAPREDVQAPEPAPKSPVRRMPLPYECLQFVLQDHNYGAPPPRTPPPPSPPPTHPKQQPVNGAGSSAANSQNAFIFGQAVTTTPVEDDATSIISSEAGREAEPEDEETETAPEGEGDDEDSVTRCICDFEHDDGYMICCDRCLVWQHVDCMGIDRSNIPDEYLCEICRPRRVDRQRARALQMRKREELLNSDTSSDTSSTSSADTDAGVNSNQKKRPLQQQVQRRKSEPQVRRLNNNNNNNVAKRQRRDTHPRQSSAVRKKEAAKRGPGKRKTKRRLSVDDKDEDIPEAWGTNMAPLRQWIERYEEAVTNHYSPELRARISSIKVNGTHNDLRQSNMNAIATGKCRLNVHSNNVRFLVATMYLPPNTPVVELRGKYMLSTQHRPSHPQGRQHVQRPGPFVFFYRLPRDGTEVCVDTRTYGNDARFVRRSCKPNAEVKHCIEKGTLHLYIVSTIAIEKNVEITIKHEQHDLLLSPNPNSPALPIACACNNPRECQVVTGVGQINKRGNSTPLAENADGRERRRRGRRNTISEESEPLPAISTITTVAPQTPTLTSPVPVTVPPRKTITNTITTAPRQAPKEETTIAVPPPETSPNLTQPTPQETKKDKKKMTREERKMEAIMKAFERLEKAEQRKQEVQARNAQRKESGGTHSDNEDTHVATLQTKAKQQMADRQMRRKRRKGRARSTSTSQSQSSRRTRLNSADSDLSSGDESNSMQSPPLLNQSLPTSRESSYLHSQAKTSSDVSGQATPSHQGIPTAAGLLLALANSNVPGPSSPPLQQPAPAKSPTCDSGASSSSQSSTPSTPLSSACLLVAAAVGPLAPGFKFPKTKKVLMNEWLKESPDPPSTNMSQVSPLPALPSTPLTNSVNPLCRPSELSLPTDPSAEFLTQSYAAKSLATLVQAANSVSGICDSPPQKRPGVTGSNTCPATTGSAKKRWLRQAISEECDSPNSRPDSPPPSEMVAPPKKRRIARESLSSDNYTPPTTPTMLLPESTPVGRSMCHNEDDFIEHPQSPTMEHSDEHDYETDRIEEKNLKNELKCNDEPMECDDQEKSSFELHQKEMLDIKSEIDETANHLQRKIDEIKSEDKAIKQEDSGEEDSEKKIDCDFDSEGSKSLNSKRYVKQESQTIRFTEQSFQDGEETTVKKESVIKKEVVLPVVEKGTVEIIDQNEPDTEMEDFSSPINSMESDAILKQRVAEMRLEFAGGIANIVSIASEKRKCEDDKKLEPVKYEERSDDNMSFDEFDVEAQMKKITGDDGNDYKEKIDTSSEKDKSMDGIEGLMESSKEDSESEDKDVEDLKYCEEPFKMFKVKPEKKAFEEYENTSSRIETDQASPVEDKKEEETKETVDKESQKQPQVSTFIATSEESMFESTSSNMETETVSEPPKIFHSIPPLSERIRKKVDPSPAPKTQLDFEAAMIESTINMDTESTSKNGEDKSMLSTALRELLEAKLDDVTPEVTKSETVNENCGVIKIVEEKTSPPTETTSNLQESTVKSASQDIQTPLPPVKEEETQPKDIVVRLKDPRTVVPNSMPAPSAFKIETPPVKRKVRTLSISEYRKRKQQSSGTPSEPEPTGDVTASDKSGARGRSDSASSGTSSLSSDEENSKVSLNLDIPSLTALPLFSNNETDEKKGGEEGTIGWSAAPTLVERQRENLTERLKREFGLFLSDDEEERARKHGLTAEAILKARKTSPSQPTATSTTPIYPLPHLPPQPYIPPPGSAAMHYTQYSTKSCPVQYPTFAAPQTVAQTTFTTGGSPQSSTNKPAQQFLVPQTSQAPPGSNPYPPQFIPPTTTALPIPKFSSATSPHGTSQAFLTTTQQQKPFFSHPAPRS